MFGWVDDKGAPIIFGKRRGFPALASYPAGFMGGLIGGVLGSTAGAAVDYLVPGAASVLSPIGIDTAKHTGELLGLGAGGIAGYKQTKRATSGEDVDFMRGEYVRAVKRKEPQEKLDFLYNEYEKAVHAHNKLVTPYVGKNIWTSYGRFDTDDRRKLYPKL